METTKTKTREEVIVDIGHKVLALIEAETQKINCSKSDQIQIEKFSAFAAAAASCESNADLGLLNKMTVDAMGGA